MKTIPEDIYKKYNLAPTSPYLNSFEMDIQMYICEHCYIWSIYPGISEEVIRIQAKKDNVYVVILFTFEYFRDQVFDLYEHIDEQIEYYKLKNKL